jgi:AcrR family transcriptional regulator
VSLSKRDRNRIEQRGRILSAARRLFAAQGFDDVTVADVARAAGVARATVFNYFPSKHALVDAITEEVLDYYGRMLELAQDDEASSTHALLRGLCDVMARGIEQVHQFYRGVFREIAKLQVGLDEGGPAADARELAVARLAELIARGQARGEITPEHRPEDLAYAFDSLVHGTIVNWLYDDPSKSLRDRMAMAAEIFLGGVARDPAKGRGDPLPDLSPPDIEG